MAIPSFWPVINLTVFSSLPICTMTISIHDGVESVKLGLLAKLHAQLVTLAAWNIFKRHQGTHNRSHHSVIF